MGGTYAALRQAQISILEILNVFLWLKFSPSLILYKIQHFETASEESSDAKTLPLELQPE